MLLGGQRGLLAHLGPDAQAELLDTAPTPCLTPRTITDREALLDDVARARRRGWAEAVEEREVGVASIAVPIRDVQGEVVAALSIGALLARLGQAARRRLAPILVEAGEAASGRLGWSPETLDHDLRLLREYPTRDHPTRAQLSR